MILGKSTRHSIILNINNKKVRSSSVVLLGFTIDSQLTFKDHFIVYAIELGSSFMH